MAFGVTLLAGYSGTTHCIPQAKYIHSRHVFSTRVHEGLLKHIPRLRFWCVIITTLYQLMLQSWYRKTAQSLVNTLVLSRHGEFFFLLWNCDKQNEMQLLAKFKQILYMGFRATLNFRKLKVALNPMYRIALNVSLSLSIYYSFRHVLKPGTPEHRNTGTP